MIGYFTANGKSSRDFAVVLSDAHTYGRAERDMEFISVPGRSGDLLVDNGRYKNIEYKYQCVITDDFDINLSALMVFLQTQDGYIRMEDSFHPDEFVLAKLVGETVPKRVTDDGKGTFELRFNRKPQRWLKRGERAVAYTSNGELVNTENTAALPLVRVYGTGAVGIGNETITVNSADVYTDIDCDLQDAFKGSANCNGNITLNSGSFWKLTPGNNGVTMGSGISRVEITPRWYRL